MPYNDVIPNDKQQILENIIEVTGQIVHQPELPEALLSNGKKELVEGYINKVWRSKLAQNYVVNLLVQEKVSDRNSHVILRALSTPQGVQQIADEIILSAKTNWEKGFALGEH